ncbi:Hsp70 family protein [Mycolicibacterium sp. XJ1819]
MSDGVGLSVGATRLAAVIVGRAAVTRSPVVTRYPHRPSEVGVPSENPNLDERGLILTDFVDRVGDPVGIVAADGSTHRAEEVLADALRALLHTVGGGRPPAGPVVVTHPAHWRPAAADALRTALAAVPEFQRPAPAPVVSDATAALTALQDDPGLPSTGVVALCDFGGTGTSITLVDAANGYAPLGATIRHTDLCGDLVDQALLTHVIEDLSAAGTIDLSGTSAIGSLSALRAQCRSAKERLSTTSVTSLMAELPGHRSEVRLTRNELDEALRQPLADFAGVLQESLERNGVGAAGLAAVATMGGGARIPIITTTLSEHLRVPVITTGQPELTAAIGAGLAATRGTVEEGATSMSAAPAAAAAAAAATAMAPEVTAPPEEASNALAWSDADDLPEVAATDPYDYQSYEDPSAVRPQMQFHRDDAYDAYDDAAAPLPWYRKPTVALATGLVVLVVGLGAVVLWVMSDDTTPAPASTTEPATSPAPPPTSAAPPPPPETTQQPPPRQTVTRQAPPPVTQTITEPPPTQEPPPPAPTEEPPPPPPAEEPPPPAEEPPPSPEPPPWSPTAPYPTIPGLPWVPAPQLPGQPAPGP